MKQYIWLAVMIIDNLLPFILARFYKGYDHKNMALSVLGCRQSPVKWYYNIWCIISGFVFIMGGFMVHSFFTSGLSLAILVLMVSYGLGCEIISGIFPINEDQEDQDAISKIHGVGSALGFTALLFCPLLLGIAAFIDDFNIWGIVCVLSFIVALTFFAFFIMGEKERFSQSVLLYSGLWQRMVLVFSYLPFLWFMMGRILYLI